MNRTSTRWVMALLTLSLAAPAIGQDRGGREGRDDRGRDRNAPTSRAPPHANRHDNRPPPRMQPPRMQPPRIDRRDDNRQRGAGPDHSLYRGARLPPQYRGRPGVVDDWRGHRLSAPPRGYHWVQVGADYVLVAIATGIILQLILDQ